MSDLSRMLDDVYAMPEAGDVATDDFPTRAPSWSSAEALDEAFASWIPGPGDGASALERSMVEESVEMTFTAAEPEVDQWLDETEPVAPEPVVAGPRRWSPSDDDILPSRRGPRRRRR